MTLSKEIEMVLAFGVVRKDDNGYSVGRESLKSINKKIENLENENILLKVLVARSDWRKISI